MSNSGLVGLFTDLAEKTPLERFRNKEYKILHCRI